MTPELSTHSGWKFGGIFWDSCFTKNIVLVQAIGICPIILASTNVKYGAVLTLCTTIILLANGLLMSLTGEKIAAWLRPPIYTLVSAGLLFGAAWLIDRYYSHEIYAALYLFIPLMAVSTVVSYRAGGFSVANRPGAAVADALGSSVGFGVAICAVSAIREAAIKGTILDFSIGFKPAFALANQPFIAFLLLGFVAAFLQWIHRMRRIRRSGKQGGAVDE